MIEIFNNVSVLLIAGGLVFIFVSKVGISGNYNFNVSARDSKIIFNMGIMILISGLVLGIYQGINTPTSTSPSTPLIPTSPSTSTSTPVTTLITTSPSAEIKNIWVEQNVVKNGRIGMETHLDFLTRNLKNKNIWVNEYFMFANGTVLKDINNKYSDVDNNVASWRRYVPLDDIDVCTNFSIFMPYNELHLNKGTYNLTYNVEIQENKGETLNSTDWYQFNYKQS